MKKSGKKSGELVQQPHGGALLCGSKPGTHKGGSGRPSSAIREICNELSYEALEQLKKLLGKGDMNVTELCRTADIGLKYTLGTKVKVEVKNEDWVKAAVAVMDEFGFEQGDDMLRAIAARVEDNLSGASTYNGDRS